MAKLAQMPLAGGASVHAGAEVHRIPRLRTRYYAFLSYSHRDHELADWLHRELEKFRVPSSIAGRLTANGVVPRRLSPVFRDQHDLSAGADLAEEIKAALAASQFLIVLCSPTAAKSRWTNAEIESFKRTRPEGCVLAAIVAGEPFASDLPGREDEECFPPALRFKYDRRGRPTSKRAEPLAADFREGGDGQRLAFLKLVAGMLGVGLDDLVQRETTRRHRRMAWLAAASLAGMAVTSTLAVFAVQARDEARDQRREAEGLVAYMVGDLKDKLEPIGKLDALDGVATRVLAYYQKQDTAQLSDAALLQRSRALSITAQVAMARGKLDQAQALYRQAAAGTAEAIRRSPNDPKRVFDHAQNIFWLGEVARNRGQLDMAIAQYSEYKRLGDKLVALEPDNLRWRMESLYGVENTGISLYNKRRYQDAERQFQSALGPMQNLTAVDPANPTYQKELPKVMGWLADSQRAQGRIGDAIATRGRQVDLLKQSIAQGSSEVDLRAQLIIAEQALGILLASKGQYAPGIAQLRAAVDEADRLIPVEPANAQWKGTAATARVELGKVLLASDQPAEAAQQAGTAWQLLASIPPSGTFVWRRLHCLLLRARISLAASDFGQALALSQQALALTPQLHSEDPLRDQYLKASISRVIGDARQGSGDKPGAQSAWAQALATLPQGVPELPSEMEEHASILQRVDRRGEAQQITTALDRFGYRRLS